MNRFNGLIPFHKPKLAEVLIEALERFCLIMVDGQSLTDCFRLVVLANDQLTAAEIADPECVPLLS